MDKKIPNIQSHETAIQKIELIFKSYPRILVLIVVFIVILSFVSSNNEFYCTKGMEVEDFINVTYVNQDVSYVVSENYIFAVKSQKYFPDNSIFCISSDGAYEDIMVAHEDKIIEIPNKSEKQTFKMHVLRNNGDYIFYLGDTKSIIEVYDNIGMFENIKIFSSTSFVNNPSPKPAKSYWFKAYSSHIDDFTIYIYIDGQKVFEILKSDIDKEYGGDMYE